MENMVNKDFWTKRNVFVTGATGLLGTALVDNLIKKHANVICLVRDWVAGSRLVTTGMLERVNVLRGELEDYQTVLRAINEYEVDTIFHLGAQTIVGTASRSALSTFEANIKGTWNLMEAAKECPKLLKCVIVASSDKAYGCHEALPYTEETSLMGRYPYDVSKSCADLIALSYYHTYKVPVAVTRCGNLFGPGDLNFNRLVPGTIRSVLAGEQPIIRSDGKFVRDYFYVYDAAEAYIQLAEAIDEKDLAGEAFNFGAERPMSVLEMVAMILSHMGRVDLEPIILNQACHEILRQYLDCSKAHNMLGWHPSHTMEDGMSTTIEWYTQWDAQQALTPFFPGQ